ATYPSMSFTTLRVLNDVSYGTAYAYVSTSGNDGTGVVSATASTAQASPYLTVAAAASAIQTFNNSNYSRNNVSGGIIRLEAGTFTHSSFSARAVGDLPLVIEAANVANKATTIYQSPASNVFNGLCDFVKFKDITIRRQNSTNAVFLDSGAGSGSTNMLVLENVTLSANGFGNSSLFMYEVGRVWLINVDGDDMGIGDPFSTANKQINIIGSTVGAGKCAYNIAASKDLNAAVTTDQIGAGNRPASKGRGIFHSHLTNNGSNIVSVENALGTDGFAVVGSVIEQRNTSTTALTMLGGTAGTAQNLLIHGTTVVGGRILYAYNDVSGTGALVRDGSIRNSVFRSYNCKGDIFANNAANIGNWPAAYKVGHRANAYLRGSDNGDTPAPGEWIGEVFALNDLGGTDASPIATDWSDDQSGGGGGAGNGEYIPGASTGLQNVPSGAALFAYDLYGNAVADDGTAYVGAGQQAAAAATDVDLDAGSYTLTGYALSVTTVQNVDLDAGSYSLTGNALDITTATQVDLDTGTYTLTGYPLAVTTIQNVDLDAGSYSLTGNDLGVTLTTVVDLDAGSYSLTGRDLSVTTVQNIDLDAGSYTLTGNDLAVDVGGDVTVNLDAGSYTLAGHDLGITTTTAVNLDAGSYALTGNPLSLAFDVNLATGAYTLTGHDLSIDAPIAVDLETGEYTLTGQDLSVQIPSGAQPGGFVPKPIIYVDAKGKPVTLKKAVREAVKAAPYREKERTKQAAARVRAAVDENEAYDRMRADLRTLASAVARVDNEIAAFLRAEAQRADDDEVATILLLAA
ncbi:MAG: hypothetical protein LPL29_00865, partial [Alphaproteobacteria bacterium]|nr:hypothetical protein [Alphaproteobacteria bacterium]